MNAEQWNRVQTLFKEIVDLDPDTRQERMESVKTEDPFLYDELLSLLQADAVKTSLIDGYALEKFSLTDIIPQEGIRIGPYEITRLIGSGGMGNVFLAKRVEGGFDQQVALKLIKLGMDSDEFHKRFERERSILARLKHQNITNLTDGGITSQGRPWFAMDYVEGIPISVYCREKKPDLNERLRLFLMIVSAVQYAHKNLVVHSDLKPDNILVTDSDGPPQIKLLDFGVARLVDPAHSKEESIRALTTLYASPEQLEGKPVTTSSDIYSMGVILYELLSGVLPYQLNGRTIPEFSKMIRSTVPAPPGDAANSEEYRGFRKRVSGDLDNICLKALSADPDQRYETAEQLADDIQSYLNHRPVTASPGTRAYRAGKFIKRHRVGVFAAATILVILISGITAFAWQYQVAATERDRAQKEADTSRQVASFLQGLFEVTDPQVSRGDTLTAFTMLERGAEQIETELTGNPELLAEMLDILGTAYYNLWDFRKSEEMFSRSESYKRQIYPEDHLSFSVNYHYMGNIHIQNGNLEAADSSLSAAIRIRRANLRQDHPDIASTLQLLGFLNQNQGNFQKAEELYSEALAIYEEQSSDNPDNAMEAASLKSSLGLIFLTNARHEEAAELFQDAVSYIQTNLGGDHPRIINYLANLGTAHSRMGNTEQAERYLIQSVETAREIMGNHHPLTANTLIRYSNFLSDQDEYQQVEQLSREALQIYTDFFDDDHPFIPTIINNLANSLDNQGKYTEAKELHRVSLARRMELYGSESHQVAMSYVNIAATLRNKEKYDLALEYFHRALQIEIDVYGENHPEPVYTTLSIAYVHKLTGENGKAEEYYLKGYQIIRDLFGDDNHETRDALGRVTRFYEDTGQPEKIEALIQ
ncbi:MAG: serine/threonine protein kinase [Balneolaceae bacterium]|nr:serine/threonine protein kinase [Balneolaceae bacterium]